MTDRTRSILAKILVVVGLGALLFLPGHGAIALSHFSEDFFARLVTRYTPAELGELTQYGCFESAISAIPDGAPAWLHAVNEGVDQRITEIAYPRIRLDSTTDGYGIYVDPGIEPPGRAVHETTCGDVRIVVVEYG